MRRVLPWGLVAVALLLLLVPLDPARVERLYSTRLYLQLQPRVTAISNSLPFAAFDLILVATVAAFLWIVVAGVRGFRRGYRWRALGRAAVRLLAIGAVLYLWFLGAWGLNYRRVPLLERLELANGPPDAGHRVDAGRAGRRALNELHARGARVAVVEPWDDQELQRAFHGTQGLLGQRQGRARALEAIAHRPLLPVGQRGRHDRPVRARSAGQPGPAAVREAVRGGARVVAPRGLRRRIRGELRGLAHLRPRRRRGAVQRVAVPLLGGEQRACARPSGPRSLRRWVPARAPTWRPSPNACGADSCRSCGA
jgi:hypothetical protein